MGLEVLDSDSQVQAAQREIDALEAGAERTVHSAPIAKYTDLG